VFGIYGEIPGKPLSTKRASRYISDIGEWAGIVTDPAAKRYATAHDLRRSFGERWSKWVMPAVLMQLMRHSSITTTMKYYVGQSADSVAEQIRGLRGSSLGSSDEISTATDSEASKDECSNSLPSKV
jgi:integrase